MMISVSIEKSVFLFLEATDFEKKLNLSKQLF
jgi:hypothetical protein